MKPSTWGKGITKIPLASSSHLVSDKTVLGGRARNTCEGLNPLKDKDLVIIACFPSPTPTQASRVLV